MVKKRWAVALFAIVSVALAGCAADTGGAADPTDPTQVEVMTWWSGGTEKASLYRLVQEFQTRNEGLRFVDSSIRGADGGNARDAISSRIAAENPPDSFQATVGAGLTTYIDSNSLQDLTGLYDASGLDQAFAPDVLDLVRNGDGIYAVPVDIRRANLVWFNTAVLDSAGLGTALPPTDIDQWIDDLETLRQGGMAYPLALGDEWAQVQLFENVLLAEFGVDYAALWSNVDNWNRDTLRTVADTYARLLTYTNPSAGSLSSEEAIWRVIGGEAAYVVSSDVAFQSFQEAGLDYGDQYASFPTPGTDGLFDLFADSFTLPVGAAHPDAARAWLLSVASAPGQRALTLAAGSIPARSDILADDYSAYQQAAIGDLATATIVPSFVHGVAASAPWTKRIAQSVVKFKVDGHPDALVNGLLAAAREALN